MTACASAPPAIEIQTHLVKPDAATLTCRDAPPAPDGTVLDLGAALYLSGLREAYEDCKAKLGAVKDFIDGEKGD